jgi:hypothetical protein
VIPEEVAARTVLRQHPTGDEVEVGCGDTRPSLIANRSVHLGHHPAGAA